ncbi:MAG: hypothetical protein UZ22_OP11002000462 [Microgenomates bacterium OLB23]|nr:MAG: hypothetical protein UZ22_OP11002000462 [Microgenomates bacterium OLB23]
MHHFEHIVTRSDVAMIKPHGEGFSHIYSKGNNMLDYLMIGDDVKTDKVAAESVGIGFFHINYFDLIA